MKIFIVSDTHRSHGSLEKALEQEGSIDMLIHLGVNEETAAEDACKMEHDISDESFAAIKRHTEQNNKE